MAVSSNQIATAARQQPAALRRIEQQAANAAGQPLAMAIAAAQRDATRQWVHATDRGAPSMTALERLIAAIKKALVEAFRGAGAEARDVIRQAAYNAAHVSAQQASALAAAMRAQPTPHVQPTIGPDATAAADAVPAAVEEERQHAVALLTAANLTALGLAGVTGVFNRARRAVGRITRHAAVAVTSAAAHAVASVAAAIGPTIRQLWVAEPGACDACAAYAGRSVRPGQKFPGGLTLNPERALFPTPIDGPPRHPHCRCWLLPYSPDWQVDGTPLPALLRQYARPGGRNA
ncbi:hypothetical protein [Streptomyces sp. OR43]|uniref:hypothetical protein n=1 Tax=Streptomyces sp. or43 TaxID=2478957 RepID=UPI0011CE925C|nr:hypothetical protein [Streptomyces sp. or43]TXS34767.1 hypothetical protein EAO72_40945 [Streptomyces sp. or43]